MLIVDLFVYSFLSYWITVLFYTLPWGRLNTKQYPDDFNHVCLVVLKNQCIYTGVYFLPFMYYPENTYSIYHAIWQIPCMIVLTDIFFFFSHYMMHSKWFFKHIHSQHHKYNIPIAAGALYAHPFEHIFVNLFSAVTPMFVVSADPQVAVLWTILASVNTVVSHSETEKDNNHGLHHRFYNCNYGAGFMLMDRVVGTYKKKV